MRRQTIAAALLTLLAAPIARAWVPSPCTLYAVDRGTATAADCLACHDGSSGSRIGSGPVPTAGSHPAGVSYESSRMRLAGFRAADQLAPEIVLVNGEISCTSCHDGRSTEPHHIVLSWDRLCTSCHQR